MIQANDFIRSTALTSILATTFAALIFSVPSVMWGIMTLVSNNL